MEVVKIEEANGAAKEANDVFENMSSYEDLKFLLKALRKESRVKEMALFSAIRG
jgi:hypothetical protein